jgi:hypothetical protein
MDFSDIGGLVNSLSTSGAQWYKLVSAPTSISVPAFAPSTAQTGQFQLAQQGLTGGTNLLLIGALILGVVLIVRR